jgi:alpha-2-macroglobulin
MRNHLLAISTLVAFSLLLSCNRSIVNLDYTNAKDEVPALGNLVFRFNKTLVKDSLLNQWDSTEYISFEPKIPGRFRWEQPDQLVFSPARPLPPATTFTAKLNRDILQYSEYGKIENADKVTFYTPYLQLDNSNVTWLLQDEHSTTAIPQVDLYFNYTVNPASLKDKMKLTIDDKPVSYNLLTQSNDTRISLQITGLKAEDKDLEAKLSLDKGLVPEGGANGTKETVENKLFIPSPYNLTINDINAEHDGITGTIYVRTSQQVSSPNISSFISFNPSVKFAVEPTDDGFAITSENFDADKSYCLLPKTCVAALVAYCMSRMKIMLPLVSWRLH